MKEQPIYPPQEMIDKWLPIIKADMPNVSEAEIVAALIELYRVIYDNTKVL